MASGTGISPIYSILKSKLPVCPEKSFRFLWGLKNESDLFFQEELRELKDAFPNFSYEIFLENPGSDWPGSRGRLSDRCVEVLGGVEGKEFFLAGNGAMIAAIEHRLRAERVLAEKIHKEIFFLSESGS